MADKKITGLPASETFNGTEKGVIVQSGETRQTDVGTAAARDADNLPALRSAATDTGSVTCEHLRANLASKTCTASGVRSANVASKDSTASGIESANVASRNATTDQSISANIASDLCSLSAALSVNVASRRIINNTAFSLALGTATSGDADTANRKIHLFSVDGNVSIAGTLTESATFTDFAEMFANNETEAIPAGTILTHDGGGVKIAQDGDDIAGVVSYTAAILAGDTPFCWQGRYLHDEFGRRLYEDIPDQDHEGEGEAPIISVLKENPEWDPTQEQVSRSDRPDEWTPAGLLGQVYVRVGENVVSGDRLKPLNGIGVKSIEKTGLRCMTVTQEYTEENGYAIARCMINVTV